MELGKKVAIFDWEILNWEWGHIQPLEKGIKSLEYRHYENLHILLPI